MNQGGTRSERAVALLLVISLLALVTLLVVSLAAITRVETQASGHVVDAAQAHANTLFALDVAVGQLQRATGPDARVTASAEALEGVHASFANNPNWVGVWAGNTTGTAPLGWLVSGNEAAVDGAPTQVPSADLQRLTQPNTTAWVTVVGTGSAGNAGAVTVPKVSLPTASVGESGFVPVPNGRFGWWVGDESQKARANLASPTSALASYLQDDEVQVAEQSVPSVADLDTVVSGLVADRNQRATVIDLGQLALVDAAADFPAAFHRVSLVSRGVLASTLGDAESGLRFDLSQAAGPVGAELANYLDYGRSMRPDTADLHTRVYEITAGSGATANGAVIDHVAPVLTDLAVGVFVYAPKAKSQDLTVRFQFFAELWNPYSSELAMKPLRIRLSGLPTITVTCSNGDVVAGIDLEAMLGGTPEIELPAPVDDLFRFLPGRVQNWTGFGSKLNGRWQAVPNSRTAGNGQLELTAAISLPSAITDTADTLEVTTNGATTLVAELFDDATNTLLSRSHSPAFDPLAKAPYKHSSVSKARISYRFRLADRVDYGLADSPGEWFQETDPRTPELGPERFEMVEAQAGGVSNSGSIALSGPTGSFFDRSASSAAGVTSLEIKYDASLFELPRQPLTSLGSLQHVGFVGARPFAIGNAWMPESGLGFDLFDRYYFSGVDDTKPGLAGSETTLRNHRLRLYTAEGATPPDLVQFSAARDGRTSRFVLSEGPLNINTVSGAVWSAVMGGGDLPDWRAVHPSEDWGAQDLTPGAGTMGVPLENAFFHFAQSAPETYELPPSLAGYDVEERAFYRRGLVTLSPAERDFLGAAIATRVQARIAQLGPFRSLGSLVEEGILAAALDDLAARAGSDLRLAARLGLPDTTDTALDAQSPSYLTQADLLTGLAPILSARGDTFVVRVYGESVDPNTGDSLGECWGEAIVQRVPDYLDATETPETRLADLNVANQRFGRRLKMLQFRWLQPSDI